MAILIEGMEMPAMCSECDFCGGLILPDNIYTCDCPSEKIHGKNITRAIEEDCRHPNCPLIEVPEPHGRLIDADALIADIKRQCREVFRVDAVSPDDFWVTRNEAYNERLWETWCESFFGYLQTRPTIIPASEEGET